MVQRDGVWTSDLGIAELGIPEGVREVVGRRLSRLSEPANAVLALASVIGSVVDVDLLIELSDLDEGAVLDALDEASAASLLRETPSGPYEFTHALVRSTLYDELSAARRVRRHRQVAEALESRGEADPAILAYHFRSAGSPDIRAVDYAATAGERALEQLAFDQAVAFFSQALEAADDVGTGAERRCVLLIGLGTAQRLAAIPAYRDNLLGAAALAQELGDAELLAKAALANSRGTYSAIGELDEERVQAIEAAIRAVGPADSPTRARLLALLAQELYWRDPELRRFELADEAVAMARRLGDEACLLEVWRKAHLSTWTARRAPNLIAELPALLELAERIGDVQQLWAICASGFAHILEMGDIDRADRLLERMGQVAAEVNNPAFRWLFAGARCGHLTVSGTGDEIEQAAMSALQIGTDAGQPDAFVAFIFHLYHARVAQGRLAEIVDLVRQQAADHPWRPSGRNLLANTLARLGERHESAGLIEEFIADPEKAFPDDGIWLTAHTDLAETVATVGTADQAAVEYAILAPYAGRVPFAGAGMRDTVNHAVKRRWPLAPDGPSGRSNTSLTPTSRRSVSEPPSGWPGRSSSGAASSKAPAKPVAPAPCSHRPETVRSGWGRPTW